MWDARRDGFAHALNRTTDLPQPQSYLRFTQHLEIESGIR